MKIKKMLACLASIAILGSMAAVSASASGNGNNIIYEDGKYIIYSGQKTADVVSSRSDFMISYTVASADEAVTAEYLGLSGDYIVTKSETEENTYTVSFENYEALCQQFEASQTLLDEGKITNACLLYNYKYSCVEEFGIQILLKEEDESFDPNSYEGMENIEFTKSEKNPKEYIAKSNNASQDYTQFKSAAIESTASNDLKEKNENIESVNFYESVCLIEHSATMKKYLVYTPNLPFDGKGDANGDGTLNIRDAAFIARALVDGKKDELPESADFNGDGEVNIRDAAAIARYLVEKEK